MSDLLPKLNLNKDLQKITPTDLINMKTLENKNLERVAKLKIVRKRNAFTAIALGLGVLGIYGYTIRAVKQEEFLDDFNEPEKISSD